MSSGISWPALNQTVCAIRFFFGVTLGQEHLPERIAYARTPSKLPRILNGDEIIRFLEAVPSLKARTALTTAYAAGLRAGEVVVLKVSDIDSERGVINVKHGKGGKDRTVMLSVQLLSILRAYWRLARPELWLFPGRDETKPIDVTFLHSACRFARTAASLDSQVTVPFIASTLAPSSAGKAERTSALSRFCSGHKQSVHHGALHQVSQHRPDPRHDAARSTVLMPGGGFRPLGTA